MIVVLTQEAEDDLERIGDFIARDNPYRAITFVNELTSRCAGLADLPNRFPLVPRYKHLGVRRRVHGEYLIFYRIEHGQIEVLKIVHGAIDYESILFSGRVT